MKYLAPFILIFVVGCAGYSPKNISYHEQIILVDNAIAGAAQSAVVALEEGYITVKEACVVHEYGNLAAVIVDQAWLSLFKQDYDNVDAYIQRAREALTGVSQEAQDRAAYHCAGV